MSASHDFSHTRKLRQKKTKEHEKPKLQYLWMVCPNCGYAWTLATNIPGNITRACPECGTKTIAKK